VPLLANASLRSLLGHLTHWDEKAVPAPQTTSFKQPAASQELSWLTWWWEQPHHCPTRFAVPLTDSHTTIPVGMVCVMAPATVLVLVIKAGATRIAFRNKQATGINRNDLWKAISL